MSIPRKGVCIAVLVGMALGAPGAGAAGYLVHQELVGDSGFGINPAGGRGDTVDVGALASQCADDEDVVDVSLASDEGNTSCGGCSDAQGTFGNPSVDALAVTLYALLLGFDTTPRPGSCSDRGDVADVTLLGSEGQAQNCSTGPGLKETGDQNDTLDAGVGDSEWCDDRDTLDLGIANSEGESGICTGPVGTTPGGDRDDAVDVGLANRENCDPGDHADVGVRNCERASDQGDTLDVSVAGIEMDDGHDTIDLAVLASEMGDGPDGNGIDVLPQGATSC
jgi:hypothetical protein